MEQSLCCIRFTDEITVAQRNQVICLRSHNWVSNRNVILTQACLVSKPVHWLRVEAVFLESPGPLFSHCFLGSHDFLHSRGTGPPTYTPRSSLIYHFCFDENIHPPVHSCCSRKGPAPLREELLVSTMREDPSPCLAGKPPSVGG